jgi:hypothetical protein
MRTTLSLQESWYTVDCSYENGEQKIDFIYLNSQESSRQNCCLYPPHFHVSAPSALLNLVLVLV